MFVKLEKGIGTVAKYLSIFGSFFLVLMMLILVAEIIMRALGSGVLGSYEIVELAMVPLIFFSLANVQSTKKNVEMDLIYNFLPKVIRPYLDLVNYFLMLALTVFMIIAAGIQTAYENSISNTSAVLYLPKDVFMGLELVGFFVLAIVLVVDILVLINKIVTKTYSERVTTTEINEVLEAK